MAATESAPKKANGKATLASKPKHEGCTGLPIGKPDKKPATHQPTPIAIADATSAQALALKMFEDGAKEDAVRSAVTEYLIKNTSKEDALHFYSMRYGYRAVRRAKAALKAAKASKGKGDA